MAPMVPVGGSAAGAAGECVFAEGHVADVVVKVAAGVRRGGALMEGEPQRALGGRSL